MAYRSWVLLCASMLAAGSVLAQADKSTVVNPQLNKATLGAAASREAAATGSAPAAAVPGVRAKPGGHDQEPPGQGPVKSRGLGPNGGAGMTPGARAKGGQTQAPAGQQGPSAVDRVGQPGLAAHVDGQGGKQDQGSTQGPVKRGTGAQMAPHEQSGNKGQGVGQTGYRPIQQSGRNEGIGQTGSPPIQQSGRSVGNSPVGQPNPAAAAAAQVPRP